ncbi:DUF433 domain-containing protein [Candidatus Parcubacteria bacterium]|nr:DUF433 domain-containing protein [Candidatus Parcubacteria bacterium]
MEKRIVINPKTICGKPVIKGTRIPVYLILNLLAAGYTFERIIKAYPKLTKKDIKAALDYAQFLTKYEEELIPQISHNKVYA